MLRRSEGTRFSSLSDDEVGRLQARSAASGASNRTRAHKTVGEFDGKIKYGRLLKPGQRIEDVVFAEKLREDAVRDLGLQAVRWTSPDLYRAGILRERVLRAFARASRSTWRH